MSFIPVFLTLVGLMLVALIYLACTAPFGWQDSLGFHSGRQGKNDFTHGEAYTND